MHLFGFLHRFVKNLDGIKWSIFSRQAQRNVVKIKNLDPSYWAWSTSWGHVLSLKMFCSKYQIRCQKVENIHITHAFETTDKLDKLKNWVPDYSLCLPLSFEPVWLKIDHLRHNWEKVKWLNTFSQLSRFLQMKIIL